MNKPPQREPFRIGFHLFPDMTQLDATGPAQVLSRMSGAELHFAAKSLAPIDTDCGLSLVPTTTLAGCPELDLICIPGGTGVTTVMEDRGRRHAGDGAARDPRGRKPRYSFA